jgi:hypothetical protein
MSKMLRVTFALALASLPCGQIAYAQQSSSTRKAPFTDLNSFVQYVNAHLKAPFDRDSARLPKNSESFFRNAAVARAVTPGVPHNVKVNQDRDIWPKAEIGMAVDPTNGQNLVVMSNDFRVNFDQQFYHVSTNGGRRWTDDLMVGGSDPFTGGPPFNFQSDPGVAFDSRGHSVLSTITGNLIFDFNNLYVNLDTQIYVTIGQNHGTYTSLLPTIVDTVQCDGNFDADGVFVCPGTLDKPLITVDNVPGSPKNGTIYVYYTYFCLDTTGCTDGSVTIPANSSVILESHAAGAGLPFSAPALVSGSLTAEQFSDLVVDSHGVPHIFFDDFSTSTTAMFESTLTAGTWVVHPTPVVTFNAFEIGSLNWFFRLFGTEAPGCGISGDTAYCAFSANQVNGGPTESSLSTYLVAVNTHNGSSKVARVNNDAFGASKDHIFPWATAKSDGSVYVGFYDDREDPANTLLRYWVAKSTDGGHTFPTQMPVSDFQFNPCIGFPFCGFFGDYTQIAAGPDGVVHAAWSDTRDQVSMQIWGQAITW